MRNLKKVLALVLALVMAMSLVTIANAADFSDAADINYDEAVDVMVAAGIIDGVGNNSFDPNGTLTREQAAKLITYMLLGENSDKLGVEGTSFNDVPATRWSAPAIEYCVSTGIVDGAGDGNFYPAGRLTGYAFAKMLLTAIGYDSNIEKFVGNGWTINVATIGMEVGLDDGLENMFGAAEISRQEAAQMALNAIKAPLVEYPSKGNTISVNGAVVEFGNQSAQYVTTTIGKEQNINDATLTNDAGRYLVEFGEKYLTKLTLVTGPDALGRVSNTWSYDGELIGVYPSEDATFTYTSDKSNTAGKSEITKALRNYKLGSAIVYYNGFPVNVEDPTADELEVETAVTAADIAEYTGNGILVQVYTTGSRVDYVTVIDSYLGQVTRVNKTDETITIALKMGAGVEDQNIITTAGYDSYEKDDYVMVSPIYSAEKTIAKLSGVQNDAVLADVEVVTGKVSSSSSSKVALDGTSYSVAEVNSYANPALKAEVNVYLDTYGYVVWTDSIAAKDFIYAVTKYTNGNSYGDDVTYFQGVKTDGSVVELRLAADSADPTAGQLYSYSISGSRIKLTAADVADENDAHYVTYKENVAVASSDNKLSGTNRYFSKDTVFISVTGTKGDLKVSMGTGKQIVKSATADYAIISASEKKSTANDDIAVVFVNNSMISNMDNLVLLADADRTGYQTLEDTDYNLYDVYINGEAKNIPVDEFNTRGDVEPVKGMLFTYGTNEDGSYVLTEVAATDNVTENEVIDSIYRNLLTTDGSTLDAGEAVIVDLTDNDIADMGILKDLYDLAGVTVEVSVIYNNDDEATYVYVTNAKVDISKIGGTYTVSTAFDEDDFSSVSYKENGQTKVSRDMSFTATGRVSSVKVSTIDGFTISGNVRDGWVETPESAWDIGEAIQENGKVELDNTDLPEGSFVINGTDGDGNPLMASIVMNGGDIEGETAVRGEVVIAGETTIKSTGDLTVNELVVTSGSTLTIEAGSNINATVWNLKAGSWVDFGSGLKFKADIDLYIDYSRSTGTINGDLVTFTNNGYMSGLVAAAGANCFDGTVGNEEAP